MSFNYDFLPSASVYRRLRAPSTPGNRSLLSTTLSTLSSHNSTISSINGSFSDYIREQPKEERYVQPGLKNIKILQKYVLDEIQVQDEIVFTWLPGYVPKTKEEVPQKKEEELTPTRRSSDQTFRCIIHVRTPQ